MKKIVVKTSTSKYPIIFTKTPFSDLKMLKAKILIITDTNLHCIYINEIKDYDLFVMKPGESSKDIGTIMSIINYLSENNFSKTDYIIAFGGGVVGDITGFVASVYKRGINFIQIPTTLLSMIDSSIGGKTGINYGSYKNMIGTIYPPNKVYISTQLLETLPNDEWLNGSGEVLKYAFLSNEVYNEIVEERMINWDKLIEKCIFVKKKYVENDEFDQGSRMHLNLGHTYGHIIEKKHNIKHGYAVAYGIRLIINESKNNDLIEKFDFISERLGLKLEKYFDMCEIIDAIKNDKKIRDGKLNLVIPKSIGNVIITKIDLEAIDDN